MAEDQEQLKQKMIGQIQSQARQLGLAEDDWYNKDESFRAAAIQERVRRELELRQRSHELLQQKWLNATSNQALILGSVLGFFGVIITGLFALGLFNAVRDTIIAIQVIFVALIMVTYLVIALCAKKLIELTEKERIVSWKEMNQENVAKSEKESINNSYDEFKRLSSFVMYLTFVIIIFLGLNFLGFFQYVTIPNLISPRGLNVVGLSLNIIGTVFLTTGLLITKNKAIRLGIPYYAPETREEKLKQPQVVNLISQSRNAIIGLCLILVGFILQLVTSLT